MRFFIIMKLLSRDFVMVSNRLNSIPPLTNQHNRRFIMSRNKGATIGILVAIAAIILFVIGCSSSNPVSPAVTDTENGKDFSPGSEAIMSEPVIDGDLLNDDEFVGVVFDKSTPEIVQFPRDEPLVPDPGDVASDPVFLDQDITSR
jgi:hypothetical protein